MIYTAKVHDVIHGDEELRGEAVLVDKLWPRGVAKERLSYDHWFKDVAPSAELRKWWGHDADAFEEFARRYRAELDENDSEELARLHQLAEDGDVTLLFAAKDREVNHATVLKAWLEES
ncbi:DUF488 domain-containing protein [Corynebacterium sp. Marseille-Q2823]|uniref:DUF488 domain-containing protein n=1 Tax=Corynebacterium sp. Marseille-Q2823 TaxID=2736606 RepID=UPI00158B717C|nr:DUF488 family protein [Corynebacterium sp. Marseille-Q2823]